MYCFGGIFRTHGLRLVPEKLDMLFCEHLSSLLGYYSIAFYKYPV